ncbi:MAG: hypothetical protein EOO23_03460 [Comamonadaceae bacterium]|nr:MAG: hypothetical protein EOO23_03460 [Comamonadaceae bacterium]
MVMPMMVGSEFCHLRPSGAVGIGQANKPEDVEFVRFGLACKRKQAIAAGKASVPRYAQFLDSTQNLQMTGGMDRQLDLAIRAFQTSQDLKSDGVVSTSTQAIAPSGNRYTFVHLVNAMVTIHPGTYPRIDLVQETGIALSNAVKKIFQVEHPSGKMELK